MEKTMSGSANIRPSIDEIKQRAAGGTFKKAPVALEMLSDIRTPIEALRILKNVSSHVFMLESVAGHEKWGRYTFLGYDPKLEISCVDGVMKVGDLTFDSMDPSAKIREIIAANASMRFEGMPPFTGGLVGYFAYDYLKYSEPTLRFDTSSTDGFRDVDLMLFDKVIAFDGFRQKIILIANISLDDIDTEYERARLELGQLAELLRTGKPKVETPGRMTGEMTRLFDKESFCTMVERGKHHIKEGDVFQVVLSNRIEAPYEGSLFNTYRVLRTLNPSPYMFYFSSASLEVAGASPETLVKLEDGVLHTFPLAGTRPRGRTDDEDESLERELLADEKELAEHNMLVDLGRNDLGRVSSFGTVKVERLHEILRFSHVMHIGSTVRGELREDRDALDAIAAVLPAGTLSGAPKIRACQIINELENCKRGIYGGAVGYLDFTGNMDMCIAIRFAYKKDGRVFVRSGCGIVADSVPENEYQECINKAAAVVKAIEAAEEVD